MPNSGAIGRESPVIQSPQFKPSLQFRLLDSYLTSSLQDSRRKPSSDQLGIKDSRQIREASAKPRGVFCVAYEIKEDRDDKNKWLWGLIANSERYLPYSKMGGNLRGSKKPVHTCDGGLASLMLGVLYPDYL